MGLKIEGAGDSYRSVGDAGSSGEEEDRADPDAHIEVDLAILFVDFSIGVVTLAAGRSGRPRGLVGLIGIWHDLPHRRGLTGLICSAGVPPERGKSELDIDGGPVVDIKIEVEAVGTDRRADLHVGASGTTAGSTSETG